MLVISAGYFLHDAVTCIRNYEDWGFAYLVHAVSCCMLYRCCRHQHTWQRILPSPGCMMRSSAVSFFIPLLGLRSS